MRKTGSSTESTAVPAQPDYGFRMDSLRADLKARTIRGAGVTVLGRATHFFLNLGSTVVLARLLTPSDFGLIVMVSAITGFVMIFRDAGLSTATIRQAEINHAQASTLFWANVILSVLVALATVGLAPLIAWFYGRPELSLIAVALAGSIFLGGLGIQHGALLKRQMRLVEVNISVIVSQLAGIGVAIGLAALGAGYWALVAKNVVDAAVNSALLWVLSGWRPGAPSRGTGVHPMLKFGGYLTGAQCLGYMLRKIDDVLIGWAWGATAVGLYSRAYSLLLLPASELNWPINSVAIPALSTLQNEPERFRRCYRKALEWVAMCGYPFVIMLIVAADEAVLTVLGDQWIASVDIFRMLGPATLVAVTDSASGWVYVPYGRSDRQLKLGLFVVSPFTIIAIVAGLPWGALGVAAAVSISRVALLIPNLWYCYRGTPLKLSDFVIAVWRPVLASTLSGAILFGLEDVSHLGSIPPLFRLLAMACAYGLIYLGILMMIPGGNATLKEMLNSWKALRSSSR